MSVTVYGSSDDLIEFEGDIYEEICLNTLGELKTLAFSNGALVNIHYGPNGYWHIRVLSGDVGVETVSTDEYESDVATVRGNINWVVCGELVQAER